MEVTIISGTTRKTVRVRRSESLKSALVDGGFFISADCDGKGNCGKCKVRVLSGNFAEPADENGRVRSCRAVVECDCTVVAEELPEYSVKEYLPVDKNAAYSLGADIGTTSFCAAVADVHGETAIEIRGLNPQRSFGSDVLSRICACKENGTDFMRRLLTDELARVCKFIKKRYGIARFEKINVVGNTVITNIFCGVSPEPIGVLPFKPSLTETVRFGGEKIGADCGEITVLPCLSGYFGADALAGIWALGLAEKNGAVLFADLGTNGEIALKSDGKIYCAAVSGGPAFEGGDIECGTGAVTGAVSAVRKTADGFRLETVNGAEPSGICGSGIIGAAAYMLESGIIDGSGAFADGKERFNLAPDVYLSQRDVRNFQLAAAAARTAIQTLIKKAGLTASDISECLLGGVFGESADVSALITTRILPEELAGRIRTCGNTALKGAVKSLGKDCVKEIEKTAEKCEYTELSNDAEFTNNYINNINFI